MGITTSDIRSAAGLYPTGVAVITTAPDGIKPFGMTVNSFTSLSLDPPLVMWNLQKSSDTFKSWHEAETFTVNILTAGQQDVSTNFATKGNHELQPQAFKPGISGCPVLKKSLSSIECKVHARYDEGDHIIIIGEVLGIESNSNAEPLVFHKGKYRKLSG